MPLDLSHTAKVESKVSIVIPVYNGMNFLSAAIESALSQTYQNIEIIVINDGSDDDGETQKICKQYEGQIVYLEQDNTGVAGALNKALKHASGDYFCWLSHDDEFLPEKTQKQIDFLKQFDREDLIVFSNYFLIDDKGDVWHESNLDRQLLAKTPEIALLRGMVNGCSLMIPMPLLRRNLPFDVSLRFTQDYEMWNRIRKQAHFVFLPETLIKYRIHRAQDTNPTNPIVIQENDNLWIKMMTDRSDSEKVLLNGSRKKYYSELDHFLKTTPYKGAQNFAHKQSNPDLDDVTVSVIIPFFNDIASVKKAVQSVLLQTHNNLDIILIDDGSTEDISQITTIVENDPRIRLFMTHNGGPGHARNIGLASARGEYAAFLDSDDTFKPEKIRTQLSRMMDEGSIFSHTSYEVDYPQGRKGTGYIESGNLTGQIYPDIISSCPIATPTVMIHSIVIKMGLKFPTENPLAEDVATWIWLAQRTPVLGIDEPLSKITWRNDSAALNLRKGLAGLSFLKNALAEHPLHKLQHSALAELEKMFDQMKDMYEFALANANNANRNTIVNLDSINLAFKDIGNALVSKAPGQLVYEVGHVKHATNEKPYKLHKRLA